MTAELVKLAIKGCSSIGAGAVISSICKPVMENQSVFKKACVTIFSMGMGGAISMATKKYIDKKVDGYARVLKAGKTIADMDEEKREGYLKSLFKSVINDEDIEDPKEKEQEEDD